MKRRWIIGVGLVLSVVAVTWMLFPREFVYEGRTTVQWLATLEAGTDRDREKAVTALQRIGGEAVEEASALLAHPDAEVRLAAFDVLEGVLESCNQNFQTMNCITGYVPGRRRAARALPPIAEAVTVCRFSEDETLRRGAEGRRRQRLPYRPCRAAKDWRPPCDGGAGESRRVSPVTWGPARAWIALAGLHGPRPRASFGEGSQRPIP